MQLTQRDLSDACEIQFRDVGFEVFDRFFESELCRAYFRERIACIINSLKRSPAAEAHKYKEANLILKQRVSEDQKRELTFACALFGQMSQERETHFLMEKDNMSLLPGLVTCSDEPLHLKYLLSWPSWKDLPVEGFSNATRLVLDAPIETIELVKDAKLRDLLSLAKQVRATDVLSTTVAKVSDDICGEVLQRSWILWGTWSRTRTCHQSAS